MSSSTTTTILLLVLLCVAWATPRAQASSNGCLWKCDIAAGQPCVFAPASQSEVDDCTSRTGAASMTAIATATEASFSAGCAPGDGAKYADRMCDVFSAASVPDGTCGTSVKTATPVPLTNGDCIKSVTSAPSDSQYNWALIQAYSLALRNKVMFHPADLANETTWAKWVRPMTDCHIKLDTVTSSRRRLAAGGTEYNSASIFEMLQDPCATSCGSGSVSCGSNGPALTNFILQFLEEGAIDLGCLVSSSLSVGSPDRCTTVRDRLGVSATNYPDCWVAGWEAIFSQAPNAQGLSTYSGSTGTVGDGACGGNAATALPRLTAAAALVIGIATTVVAGVMN